MRELKLVRLRYLAGAVAMVGVALAVPAAIYLPTACAYSPESRVACITSLGYVAAAAIAFLGVAITAFVASHRLAAELADNRRQERAELERGLILEAGGALIAMASAIGGLANPAANIDMGSYTDSLARLARLQLVLDRKSLPLFLRASREFVRALGQMYLGGWQEFNEAASERRRIEPLLAIGDAAAHSRDAELVAKQNAARSRLVVTSHLVSKGLSDATRPLFIALREQLGSTVWADLDRELSDAVRETRAESRRVLAALNPAAPFPEED